MSELHQITNNYFYSLPKYPLIKLLWLIDTSTNDTLFTYNLFNLINNQLEAI